MFYINYLELLLILIFVFGFMFIMRLQPVFIVRRLIIITLFYSFFIYKVIGSYWFRYLLLLVMLRGVLVVFTYIVSLIPNENFEIYGIIFVFIFMFFFIKYYNIFNINIGFITLDLWESYLGIFSLFLISFLLTIIFLVVLLRDINLGSIRIS